MGKQRNIDRDPIYAIFRDRAGIDFKIAEVRAKLAPLHAELDHLLRERANMNNDVIAKMFGISKAMVCYLENGER